MNDDYWLNDLIDKAYALNKAEPWLEVPAIIVRTDETMREHDRRIVGIKEKYTLNQWLEAEKEARLEIEEEEDE